MVIWQTQTSHLFQALDYVNEYDVRVTLDYVRGRTSLWQPFYVVYATDVYDDMDESLVHVPNFPSLSGHITCDGKAKQLIVGLVRDHVQFLPLLSSTMRDRRYNLLFPKTVLDCLDTEQSEFGPSRRGNIRGIRKYAFRREAIGNTPIFRLPARGITSHQPYVNDRFKQLVEANNLTGLKFKRVWQG